MNGNDFGYWISQVTLRLFVLMEASSNGAGLLDILELFNPMEGKQDYYVLTFPEAH